MLQVTADQLDVVHATLGFYAGGMKEHSRWWSEAEPPEPKQTRTAPAGAGSCGGKIPVVDTNRLCSDVPPGLGDIPEFPNGIDLNPLRPFL